ncbi:MAG: class I SAM-dependent RNA methyltransferase [Firmicutes bacterium]|nr:class I SAM-dependent RNA methyltransferase [Bacillota bacterium]
MSGNLIKNMVITDLTEEGNGVGRHDGKVVFVKDGLPGEMVNVRVLHSKKKFDQGEVIVFIEKSPVRHEPFCMHYGTCGGCSLQHLNYEEGLKFKTHWVKSAFAKIARLNIEEPSIIGIQNRWKYRNKVVFHGFFVDGVYNLGFYRKGSNSFVPIRECLLIPDDFLEIKSRVEELAALYNVFPEKVMLRSNGKEFQVSLDSGDGDNLDLLLNELKSEFSNLKDIIEFVIDGRVFEVSSNSFFQVNIEGAKALFGIVEKMVGDVSNSIVYDLCCGVGSLGVFLGKAGARIRGYEVVDDAVVLARKNAERNGLNDYSFTVGRVEDVISSSTIEDNGVVILDPPRGGVEPVVIDSIINSNVSRVVYVGCGLGKMVRDVAKLVEGGFVVSGVECVDMFPWTGHVETVVLITRDK